MSFDATNDYTLWLAGIKPRYEYPGEARSALVTERVAPPKPKTLREQGPPTRYFAIALNSGGIIYLSDVDMMERFGVVRSMGEMLPDQSGYIQKVLTPEQMGTETMTGMMDLLPNQPDSPIPFGLLRPMPSIAASAEPPGGDPIQEGVRNYHKLRNVVAARMDALRQAAPLATERFVQDEIRAELHDIDQAMEENDWETLVRYGIMTDDEAERIAAQVGESVQVQETAPTPTPPPSSRRSLSDLASALRR